MIFLQPEEGTGEEEIAYFVAAKVEDFCAPAFVLADTGVFVLVEMGSVEEGQAVAVFGEVGGHPIEQHADAVLVAIVHKIVEVVGRAKATGGGEIACDLIAPGAVVGVFGDGQEFDVGVADFLRMGYQLVGQLPVTNKAVILRSPLPTAQMDFVDVDGLVDGLCGPALGHPFLVMPGEAVDVPDYRSRGRALLGGKAVGVRLVSFVAHQPGFDRILILRAYRQIGQKKLPGTAGPVAHHIHPVVPEVEGANDADPLGIGRPDGKLHAVHPVHCAGMAAQLLEAVQKLPLAVEVQVKIGQPFGLEAIGVFDLVPVARGVFHQQAIGEGILAPGEVGRK